MPTLFIHICACGFCGVYCAKARARRVALQLAPADRESLTTARRNGPARAAVLHTNSAEAWRSIIGNRGEAGAHGGQETR